METLEFLGCVGELVDLAVRVKVLEVFEVVVVGAQVTP
jgi:hypothetical protein